MKYFIVIPVLFYMAYCTLFLTLERPKVIYFNQKYIKYFTITAKRHNRQSLQHYVDMHFETTMPFGDNVTLDIFVYEFLSNEYRRSFVEMHLKLCDFLHKDKFLGVALRQGKFAKPCPYPADVYDLYNMTVNSALISQSFPFRKGRIYGNISVVNELVIAVSFDMEIRELRGTNKKAHN